MKKKIPIKTKSATYDTALIPVVIVPTEKLSLPPEEELLRPPSDGIKAEVEKSIKCEGVKEALDVTEDGQIIDGVMRYEIAIHLGLQELPVRRCPLNKEEAFLHRLRREAIRRHLSPEQHAAMILLYTDELERLREAAARRRVSGLKGRKAPVPETVPEREVEDSTPGEAREKLATVAGVSGRTIQKLINIKDRDPKLLKRVIEGETNATAAEREAKQGQNSPSAGAKITVPQKKKQKPDQFLKTLKELTDSAKRLSEIAADSSSIRKELSRYEVLEPGSEREPRITIARNYLQSARIALQAIEDAVEAAAASEVPGSELPAPEIAAKSAAAGSSGQTTV